MAEEGGGIAAAYEAFVLKHASRLNTFESIAQVRPSLAHPLVPALHPRRHVISSQRRGGTLMCEPGSGHGMHIVRESRVGPGMDDHGGLTNPGWEV